MKKNFMAGILWDLVKPRVRITLFYRQKVISIRGFILPIFISAVLSSMLFLCSFQTGLLLPQRGPLTCYLHLYINISYSPQCFMHILTEQYHFVNCLSVWCMPGYCHEKYVQYCNNIEISFVPPNLVHFPVSTKESKNGLKFWTGFWGDVTNSVSFQEHA